MDESANKVLESKGSDADIRQSRISRIAVEGYDTSLRMVDVDGALREHLASCGNIIHVYVPINVESGILCRFSLVYVNEEDEEKVLRLDGSDMGGRILKIKSYPFHQNHLNEFLDPMKDRHTTQRTLVVTTDVTSLPLDVIEMQLEKYFSADGSFAYPDVSASGASIITADVHVWGQEGVEKALELSGRSVGDLNFVVTRVFPLPKVPRITGYNLLHFIQLNETMAENQQKKKRNQKKRLKKKQKKKEKKSKTREGNEKKKSETRDGDQKKKGVEISF